MLWPYNGDTAVTRRRQQSSTATIAKTMLYYVKVHTLTTLLYVTHTIQDDLNVVTKRQVPELPYQSFCYFVLV